MTWYFFISSLEVAATKEAKEKEAWERRKNYDPLGERL
jgi:hypothetical protein